MIISLIWEKVYELWVTHFINRQERLSWTRTRQWSTVSQVFIARSVNPCKKMELAIWKLCRYRIFSLLVVGNMIAYMNRLAINFALLSMSPKNKVNKNGTCFNNSVLVQTHNKTEISMLFNAWNSFADWLTHQTAVSAIYLIQ